MFMKTGNKFNSRWKIPKKLFGTKAECLPSDVESFEEDRKQPFYFRNKTECDGCKQFRTADLFRLRTSWKPVNWLNKKRGSGVNVEKLCDTCRHGVFNEDDVIYEIPASDIGEEETENIYEAVAASSVCSDSSWSESEDFESYSEDDLTEGMSAMLLDTSSSREVSSEFIGDRPRVPSLPPLPENLSPGQLKCRQIVQTIIDSEESYVQSLNFILEEYRDALLGVDYLMRGKLRSILSRVAEIVEYHHMFQIELQTATHEWDITQALGDAFTASFSKSIVIDAYSEYVNNYTVAMEDIRKIMKQKQIFADMLQQKAGIHPNRLSIFCLMVKPIQRFPQFIVLLQDLLKHTPYNHHDRVKLQRALTELEGIAQKLNYRKHVSEQRLAAKQIVSALLKETITWRFNFTVNKDRFLVRQDGFLQVLNHCTPQVYKPRRLIMLSDLLICVNVYQRTTDEGLTVERYKVKWCVPIKDIEMRETSITPDVYNSMKPATRWHEVSTLRLEPTDEDPMGMLSELTDLLYDYSMLSQIQTLADMLRHHYPGVTDHLLEDTLNSVQLSIHQKDEQIRLVSSCSFVIEVPIRTSKQRYVFQAMSAQHKEDWITDLHLTKLALDSVNIAAWNTTPGTEEVLCHNSVLFVKSISVDIPRHFAKIQCAVPVLLKYDSFTFAITNHLWVCSSLPNLGQVSLIALQCNSPRVLESFIATDCHILCSVMIPGCGGTNHPYVFQDSTVWMATANQVIFIYETHNIEGLCRQPISSFTTVGDIHLMKFHQDQIFGALPHGQLVIYSRTIDGVWNIRNPKVITIGRQPITCLLVMDDYLIGMCETSLSFIDSETHNIERVAALDCEYGLEIQDAATAGMGLWISFRDCSVIHLYHMKTLERLQDINISSVVKNSFLETDELCSVSVSVTCLVITKGILWIGTNTGHILTMPLPRLSEGLPQITQRPDISYHAHCGPVKFIIPLYCTVIPKENVPTIKSAVYTDDCCTNHVDESCADPETESPEVTDVSECSNDVVSVSSVPSPDQEKTSSSSVSNSSLCVEPKRFIVNEELSVAFQAELRQRLLEHAKKWKSTPVLVEKGTTENVNNLYGSLMNDYVNVYSTVNKSPFKDFCTLRHRASKFRRKWSKIKAPRSSKQSTLVNRHGEETSASSHDNDAGVSTKDSGSDENSTSSLQAIANQSFNTSLTEASHFCDLTLPSNEKNAKDPIYNDCRDVPVFNLSTKSQYSKLITVVSGGDGYRNWSEDDLTSVRSDARIMVWMYKADF